MYSPLLTTVVVLHVSGVARQEKTLATTRHGYGAYVATTPAFVPWFPRKTAGRTASRPNERRAGSETAGAPRTKG